MNKQDAKVGEVEYGPSSALRRMIWCVAKRRVVAQYSDQKDHDETFSIVLAQSSRKLT